MPSWHAAGRHARADAEVHPALVGPAQRRLTAAMPPRLQPIEVPLPLLRAVLTVPLTVLALAPEVVRQQV